MAVSTGILWKVPHSVLKDPTSYSINIYVSNNGENGTYSLINTISAGGGNIVNSYIDPGGDPSFFYYVTYIPAGGAEGNRTLAIQLPGITEQRLAEQIQGKLPEIILARLDANLIDIRKAQQNALDILNAFDPPTSYTYTNLPGRFEGPIIVLSMTLLYLEHQLQVAIRDYSYGGTGINLSVDRNSKFASTIQNLNQNINDLLGFIKHADWPESIGLGTVAISTPQARIFGIVFGTSS